MPLCPQITNTPITVVLNSDFTVTDVIPVLPANTEQLDEAIVLIDGKTKAYYQSSEPASGMTEGDLWFDTDDGYKLYFYTGSAWTSVQDTSIAAAQSAATAAQTTADGKNKVYRQTSQPTGGTYVEGDLWFDTDDDNKIYRFTSGSWGTAVTLGNNALASISANKITAGTIDASVITVSNINAGNISTGTLAAARIAAGSLDATKIVAGSITATQISSSYVYAGTIAAGSITAGTLSASVALSAVSGTIGGFTIDSTSIYSGTSLQIQSSGSIIGGNSSTLFYGFVNIGGGFPTGERLIVNGNSSFVGTIVTTGNVTLQSRLFAPNLNTSSAATNLRVATGSIGEITETSASSIRFKENIVDIDTVFDLDPKKLLSLPVRAFTYNQGYLSANDDRVDVMIPGFIAEEIDAIYPIAVDYGQDEPHSWNDRMMIPALLALVQDLYKEIAILKGE